MGQLFLRREGTNGGGLSAGSQRREVQADARRLGCRRRRRRGNSAVMVPVKEHCRSGRHCRRPQTVKNHEDFERCLLYWTGGKIPVEKGRGFGKDDGPDCGRNVGSSCGRRAEMGGHVAMSGQRFLGAYVEGGFLAGFYMLR